MPKNREIDEFIINTVKSHKLKEQKELQDFLSKAGYNLPQATLSRRLKKLKIFKLDGFYEIVLGTAAPALPCILKLHIAQVGLIVLHTPPGQAQSLAYYLDNKFLNASELAHASSGFLGTIAGDDTVLCIPHSLACVPSILEEIYKDFPYLKNETAGETVKG